MSTLDRSTPPRPGPIREFSFPPVREIHLSNGVPLDVVYMPRLPVATALLVLPAGEDGLSGDRAGTALLAGDALDGGTHTRGGEALAEALESLGADLDVSTGWSATTVAVSCLAERLPAALALMAEMVLEPAFPETDVRRVREQQLARIRQRAMDPGALAWDHLAADVYADGEPYGRSLRGTLESVGAVTSDTLAGFSHVWYRPRGAALVVAGDVQTDEVASAAESLLGSWTGAPPSRPVPEGRARDTHRRIRIVHRPGAVQSELALGHTGAPRANPDHEALVVANAVLGGTFSSRLNLNLRETHGFTYGVRSRFSFRRGPGPFSVTAAVDTGVTAAAVREAVGEMERYVAEGPSDEEVASARDYLAGVFPLRLESTGQVAGRVAELRVFDLPADTWSRYRERIRAVTQDSAWRAAQDHIRPRGLSVTVVGDADEIQRPLEDLGLGPVTVVP